MEPVVQAEPLEAQMPSRSSSSRIAAAVSHRAANCLQDAPLEPVAQGAHPRIFVIDLLQREFGGFAEGDNIRDILGAAALASLLPTTDDVRLKRRSRLNVQQTDTLGRAQLVGGEGEEIDTEFLHVDRQFTGDLNGVGVKQYAVAAADRREFLHREQHASFVVCPHERDDGGVGPDGRL